METTNFKRHQTKCRICLQPFRKDQLKIPVTDDIESKFLSISQIELRRSANYSNKICWICKKELETFANYKNRISTIQLELYMKYPDNEVTAEDPPHSKQQFDIQEVVIKQETDNFDEKIKETIKTESEPAADPSTFEDHFSDNSDHFQNPPSDPVFDSDSDSDFDIDKSEKTLKWPPLKTNIKLANCRYCGLKFRNILLHLRQEHPEAEKFSCDLCGYANFKKFYVNQHIKKVHLNKKTSFSCKICSEVFPSPILVSTHTSHFHKKTEKGDKICEICGAAFHNAQQIRRHIKVNHREPTIPCTVEGCKKMFHLQAYMTSHIKKFHSGRNFKCDKCPKAFKTLWNMNHHKLNHHTEPTIPCTAEGCNKMFGSKHSLRKHIEHIHKRQIKCDLCSKAFNTSDELNKHIAGRHQEWKLRCPVEGCFVEFVRKYVLKNHVVEKHKNLNNFELEEALEIVKSMTKPDESFSKKRKPRKPKTCNL